MLPVASPGMLPGPGISLSRPSWSLPRTRAKAYRRKRPSCPLQSGNIFHEATTSLGNILGEAMRAVSEFVVAREAANTPPKRGDGKKRRYLSAEKKFQVFLEAQHSTEPIGES